MILKCDRWFQEISIPIPRAPYWNFRGQGGFFDLEIQRHGGTYNWNSEGIGWGGGEGGSRLDRQECESTNKLMTLLTIVESKIQDKHQSTMHVFFTDKK